MIEIFKNFIALADIRFFNKNMPLFSKRDSPRLRYEFDYKTAAPQKLLAALAGVEFSHLRK